MMSFRLTAALFGILVLASCGGPSGAPAPTPAPMPSPAGPTIRLVAAADRLTTYADRIEDEVLAPYAEGGLPRGGEAEPPDCPGIGEATNAELEVVTAENLGSYVAPIKNWLAGNGFAVTEQTVAGLRTVTGRSKDGFTITMTVDLPSSVRLILVSPCAWPESVPGGPTNPLPKATPKTMLEARSIELACEKPELYVYSLKAPPYRGAGPHLVTTDTQLPDDTVGGVFFLPDGWETGADTDSAESKRKSQLIVCVSAGSGETVGSVSCQYDVPTPRAVSFAFNEASYEVKVLTARTGQLITSFTLPGTESEQDSCPAAVSYTDRTQLLRGVDALALQARLRPLITGRR